MLPLALLPSLRPCRTARSPDSLPLTYTTLALRMDPVPCHVVAESQDVAVVVAVVVSDVLVAILVGMKMQADTAGCNGRKPAGLRDSC